MKSFLLTLLIVMVALFLVDLLWLSTVGQYAVQMTKRIQGSDITIRYGAMALVYVALGLLLLQATSVYQAGLIGGATYAVYDFTSYSILKDYDLRIAVADTVWGGVLFSTVYAVLDHFNVL